ncbi:cytochrome P450 [Lipomyces starkeyi]
MLDKYEHAWKKRILSQKLSDSAVRSFEPKISEIVVLQSSASRVQRAGKGSPATQGEHAWSEPFNMSDGVSDNLFFDLVTNIIFGENFDLIRRPWYRHIPESLARSNERMSVIVQFPLVLYRRLDKVLFRDSVYGRKEFLRFVHNLMTERMTRGSRNDVFSVQQDEIVAESILKLVAGSDTSSTLLASMFFYLTRNPDKKHMLSEEIRTQFASREDIRLGAKLSSCRYLHACISQCLRMAPPVAAAPFREVSKCGIVVDRHFVPEGVNVGTWIFSIQHNERYFHNPFEFTPERWLADGKLSQAHEPDAYVPFSIGPRVCLGKWLAISEVSLAMAHICWTMDFAVVESMKDIGGGNKDDVYGRHRPGEFQLYYHITCTRNGPMVQFRERSCRP